MITKINHIKNFGVFKNFQGNSIPDFKTFNLIYGWNYSGKTTLSRMFRCFEKKEIHVDYADGSFEVADENRKYDQSLADTPVLRVFNADFIKDNLKWDQDHFEPIFLLGQENIDLQDQLQKLTLTLTDHRERSDKIRSTRTWQQKSLNTALTDQARTIGQLLGLRNFDRTSLMQLIESIKPGWDKHILDDTVFHQFKGQALSNEEKPIINNIEIAVASIESLSNDVAKLLGWTSDSKKIEALINNSELSRWVDEGRKFHQHTSDCQFCGQQLPPDLITQINNHFSEEFDKFKLSANELYKTLVASEIRLDESKLNEILFYPTYKEAFIKEKIQLDLVIEKYNTYIQALLADLRRKLDKPFDILNTTNEPLEAIDISGATKAVNKTIEQNNLLTTNFQIEKANAILKIKTHLAAEFAKKQKYVETQKELKEANQELEAINEMMEKINVEMLLIQNKLSETVKGAEQINSFLKQFFGKDDIHIDATEDKKFKLLRGTIPARNLSEGEKTAIAFAYFITKLSEKNLKLRDTIIYIDDPISSLDANHLFNIFAFIKSQFYEFDKSGNPKHVCKCMQLFISTHNLEFHYLLADWFGKMPKYCAFYHIERHFNPAKDESTIKEGTWKLGKFKSEYLYLFSLMHAFQQNPSLDFDNYYHLPNIMRRFTETYLNFKFQSVTNIDENIAELITDPIECERARKFMHYYSHALSTNKFMRNTDLQESQAVMASLLNAVERHDPIHYRSLIEKLKEA